MTEPTNATVLGATDKRPVLPVGGHSAYTQQCAVPGLDCMPAASDGPLQLRMLHFLL
jgi:hypothetical protein